MEYAFNKKKELVHIDKAIDSENYFCESCGELLIIKSPEIKVGDEYYRRKGFFHTNGTWCNGMRVGESYTHKQSKILIFEYISNLINNNKPLNFTYLCECCNKEHISNLLRNVKGVKKEGRCGNYRPDILLYDDNNNPLSVIELIVTHKPEKEVIEYYKKNNINLIQIILKRVIDINNLTSQFEHLNKINYYPCDGEELYDSNKEKNVYPYRESIGDKWILIENDADAWWYKFMFQETPTLTYDPLSNSWYYNILND